MYRIKRFSSSKEEEGGGASNLALGAGALGVAGGLGTMYKAGSDWKKAGDEYLKNNPLKGSTRTLKVGGQVIENTRTPELEFTRTGAKFNAPGEEAYQKFKQTDVAKKAKTLGTRGKYIALGGAGLLATGAVLKGISKMNNEK